MTTPCAHVLRDADALTTVCLLCGHTHTREDPQAAQRARTASLLAYWASTTGDVWPGVAPGHRALLEHLAHVLARPLDDDGGVTPCPPPPLTEENP